VVNLLDSMLELDPNASARHAARPEPPARRLGGFAAVAGRSGTLAHRMRRTAAQGKCHAKTGTLTGVSALSGYCFQGADDAEHAVVFSLLMNRVDVNRARLVQDRMAALIARYRR
jgi:D-alanyl-D-alanine carboxypeptidase